MAGTVYDLAVIGGGINGAGVAADAAGRGLKVVLLEKADLAAGTSSASSKLIHGGLRYLEHFEFRLVRHALAEREVLLHRAEHLVRPIRFVIPHVSGMRSRPLMRAGLFLYDWLAPRRRIPSSGALDLSRDPMGRALRPDIGAGFFYYDCQVDDARLVVSVARDAADRGAEILTRTPVTRIARDGDGWRVDATSDRGRILFLARAVVNAAGPWCAEIARLAAPHAPVPALKLVRGAHIVVPRIAGVDDAYLLQHMDGRIVFVVPFSTHFTLIGTTEVLVSEPSEGFAPSAEEDDYLIEAVSRYLSQPIARRDIVWRFAGVRPLVDDGAENASAVTRDWRLDLTQTDGAAPFLTVVGGKLTTFRLLAEDVLEKLAAFFPGMGPAWTANAPLPGGDFGPRGMSGYVEDLARARPGLARTTRERLVDLYGTRVERVLGDATHDRDLGAPLCGGLTPREVRYLRNEEWARTPGDVLWRRTKTGLGLSPAELERAKAAVARALSAG